MSNYPTFDIKSLKYKVPDHIKQEIENYEDLSKELMELTLQKKMLEFTPAVLPEDKNLADYTEYLNKIKKEQDDRVMSRIYGHYYDNYPRSVPIQGARFVGGPHHGKYILEVVDTSYVNYCGGIIRVRAAHQRNPYENLRWDSDPTISSDSITIDYTEHIYRRQDDGHYYCEDDLEDLMLTPEQEELIQETKSDRITMAERKTMKELVNNPEWQAVRKRLLGQWKERPTWCCQQLSNYLGSASSASNEKLKIVMNYLTGTGFRTGRIKHPCISNLRKKISLETANRKKKGVWESYQRQTNNSYNMVSNLINRSER